MLYYSFFHTSIDIGSHISVLKTYLQYLMETCFFRDSSNPMKLDGMRFGLIFLSLPFKNSTSSPSLIL